MSSLAPTGPFVVDAKESLERNAKENFRLPLDTIPAVADSDPNYRGKHLQLKFRSRMKASLRRLGR